MTHLLPSIPESNRSSFHFVYNMLFLFFYCDDILVPTIFISQLHSVQQYCVPIYVVYIHIYISHK